METIFHTALSLGGDERVSYLSEKCSNDAALLTEVESLITAFESEANFLEEPAFSLGMNVLGHTVDRDLTGEKIGFYEIKERLGGGGMGDVYLAEDTRLDRKVALKFLKGDFGDDKWAKRQFINEAQAVARLEHPNICAVHNIEEIDEHNFIVMQFVEGLTLAEFISERAEDLSLEKILSIAQQIVRAVTAAHSHGVIHRDIKPGNIMITSEGSVKVLDFGLAKIVEQQQKTGLAEEHNKHISQPGLILGTVSYMSPEQLRGEKLDFRSDIFSVGIVLYEMLAKKSPFTRKSQAETIAAILGTEPSRLREGKIKIPDALDAIVHKCLDKDKEKRFESATALQIELENFKEGITVKSRAQKFSALYRYAAFVFLFVILVGAALFLYLQGGKIPKLAVLPITNESEQADKDSLSEELTANLIEKFSHLSGLKVVAPTIVSHYKGPAIDAQIAGKELEADVVMVGKLVRQENNFILKVNLVDVADGTATLVGDYSVEDALLVDVPQAISSQILDKLRPSISEAEQAKVGRRATDNPEAYKLYANGRYFLNRRDDPENMDKAIDFFTKAIKADPAFALAWAGLADSYVLVTTSSFKNPLKTKDAVVKAKAAANEAIEIDSELAEPYVSLGIIKSRYDWDWRGAENDFKRAISLKSQYAPAYYWYSRLLALMGRYDEALTFSAKAKELDPFTVSSQINSGNIYFWSRNYDEAGRVYQEVFNNNPDNLRKVTNDFGWLYLQTGKIPEAIDIFEHLRTPDSDYGLAGLGYAYARVGRSDDALKIIDEMKALEEKKRTISSQERAIVYIGLNDKDKAFENLFKACEERYAALPQLLAHDPVTDSLRSDPRFPALLSCVNLPAN